MSNRKKKITANTTQKTKDWASRITLKAGNKLIYSVRVNSSSSTSGTRRATLVKNPMIKEEL